jgi:hypothetical protein
MTEYLIGTFIVILVIVVLNFINLGKRFRSKSNVDNAKIQEMKELFELMQRMNEDGTNEDEIPEGYGEFGYELTNPIPVNTAFGSASYLTKLKTLSNQKVSYERLGSFDSPVSEHPVDGYIISSGGKELATLYFSCYHKKNSENAPQNFKF